MHTVHALAEYFSSYRNPSTPLWMGFKLANSKC